MHNWAGYCHACCEEKCTLTKHKYKQMYKPDDNVTLIIVVLIIGITIISCFLIAY